MLVMFVTVDGEDLARKEFRRAKIRVGKGK